MLLADPIASEIIKTLNPDFVAPKRPFMRMDYRDAITYLKDNGITKEDGTEHVIGDDIAEAAERRMTDQIDQVIMLVHFPKALKSFYMQPLGSAPDFTESVDVLVPGVGEVVGGSMRISDLEELMKGYKREGIPHEPYYWFTDQRKYGTTEHGGYGLGVEVSLERWHIGQWEFDADVYSAFSLGCSSVILSGNALSTPDGWDALPPRFMALLGSIVGRI
jgi:asparaginyl-tRNA synthetase